MEKVKEIKKLIKRGNSLSDISRKLNLSRQRISQIVKKHNVSYKRIIKRRYCTCLNCRKKFIARSKLSKFCDKHCYNMFLRKFFYSLDLPTRKARQYDRMAFVKGISVVKARKIMEEHLGRKLKKKEAVHHVDGNPKNNNISNLMVLTSSQHSKLHWKERKVLIKEFENACK